MIEQARALVPDCDAPIPSVYSDGHGGYICRCVICGRCGHHTGNSNQGHYWKFCKVMARYHDTHKTKEFLDCEECMPAYHQCCPGNCSLYNEDGTKKDANVQN